jgi:hypothetical protein
MSIARHKVFITYHHDDQVEVDSFISAFDVTRDVFISRAVGMAEDLVNSSDTDYVMRRIRQLYIKDSTVTIVLIGRCTWSRKYVDWEIKSSLQTWKGFQETPNGLLGIVLPSAGKSPTPPERLKNNLGLGAQLGYAQWHLYPQNSAQLSQYIDGAFEARMHRLHLINNPRDMFQNNRPC